MTTRSASSLNYIPREDSDVYQYALRVAILSHVLEAAAASVDRASSSVSSSFSAGTEHTASTGSHAPNHPVNGHPTSTVSASSMTRPSGKQSQGTSSSSSGFRDALSSMFRDSDNGMTASSSLSLGASLSSSLSSSSSGRVKFPKEFLKVLEQRLVKISQGADQQHQDQLFRATVGAFYGVYKDKTFQSKLLDSRQIEEVILRFASVASDVLKKRLPGDEWKAHWDGSVGEFAAVVRDALKGLRGVSPELLQRLETYYAPTSSSRPNERAASTSKNTLDGPSTAATHSISSDIRDMPKVLAVGRLFAKTEADLEQDAATARRICTEQVRCIESELCMCF